MKYEDLNVYGKINCLNGYIFAICPYDVSGELENAPVSDVEYSIVETLKAVPEYTIDERGNWYYEGEEVE